MFKGTPYINQAKGQKLHGIFAHRRISNEMGRWILVDVGEVSACSWEVQSLPTDESTYIIRKLKDTKNCLFTLMQSVPNYSSS